MTFHTFIFYLFAAILVFAALRVITTRNPVQAALWLVLSFFTAAAIWLLLQAEFLAIALVLVYVGAVMVLFLFVVMMLDVNFEALRQQFRSYVPIGALVGALVLLEMTLVIVGSAIGPGTAEPPPPAGSNTAALGRLIYVDYVYPFEIAAVVLLVAIVAAIALTHRERKTSKYQAPGRQVKVRREERVRLVNLPSETVPSAVEPEKTP
jgi:NADH-quinone oxidoreductase subunit J